MKFKVGDRVKMVKGVIAVVGKPKLRNKVGRVVEPCGGIIGVDFAESGFVYGHKLGGKITTETGWWVVEDCLEHYTTEVHPYEHDCLSCRWVGWFTPSRDLPPMNVYVCGDKGSTTVIIRRSSEGGDYWAMKEGISMKEPLTFL